MRLVQSLTFAATVFIAGTAVATPVHTVLDFDTDRSGNPTTPGNIVGSLFSDRGVLLSSIGSPLALFNSNCGTDFDNSCNNQGKDADLASGPAFGTAPQGRVLILNGGSDAIPNDDASGGTFGFSFTDAGGVDVKSVSILDLDESKFLSRVSFTATFADLSTAVLLASSVDLLGTKSNNNSLRRFNFGANNVTALDIRFQNISGAIGAVSFDRPAPIPVPAALPLLVTALAGLGWMARRRQH